MSLVKPISYESRIISGFLESNHFVKTRRDCIAVQQNRKHLRLADKTPLSA